MKTTRFKHSIVQLMKVYNCNLIFWSHWFRVSKSQTMICYVVQRRYTSLISNSSKITRQKTTKVVHFFLQKRNSCTCYSIFWTQWFLAMGFQESNGDFLCCTANRHSTFSFTGIQFMHLLSFYKHIHFMVFLSKTWISVWFKKTYSYWFYNSP